METVADNNDPYNYPYTSRDVQQGQTERTVQDKDSLTDLYSNIFTKHSSNEVALIFKELERRGPYYGEDTEDVMTPSNDSSRQSLINGWHDNKMDNRNRRVLGSTMGRDHTQEEARPVPCVRRKYYQQAGKGVEPQLPSVCPLHELSVLASARVVCPSY